MGAGGDDDTIDVGWLEGGAVAMELADSSRLANRRVLIPVRE
jgi:hypothetical protein